MSSLLSWQIPRIASFGLLLVVLTCSLQPIDLPVNDNGASDPGSVGQAEKIAEVFSAAKTVADCFKFRNKIGLDVALEALKEGYRKKMFTPSELHNAAEICRVKNVIRPYEELILS